MSVASRTRAAELEEELIRNTPGIALYNAGHRVIVQRCNGTKYRLPIDGKTRNPHTGEIESTDGILLVYDQWDVDPQALEKWRLDGEKGAKPTRKVPVMRAYEVASYIVGKKENLGLEILNGKTPEENEAKKEQAKKRYLAWRKSNAEQIVADFHKKTQGFHQDPRNLGKREPLMNDEEREAQNFLSKLKLGEYDSTIIRCRFRCGFASYVEDDLELHYRAEHSEDIAAERQAEPTDEEPRKKGGRKAA